MPRVFDNIDATLLPALEQTTELSKQANPCVCNFFLKRFQGHRQGILNVRACGCSFATRRIRHSRLRTSVARVTISLKSPHKAIAEAMSSDLTFITNERGKKSARPLRSFAR